MARVTIDDCVDKVDNQFDLALLAAKRANQIETGSPTLVSVMDDTSTVIALREIAKGVTTKDSVEAERLRRIEAESFIPQYRSSEQQDQLNQHQQAMQQAQPLSSQDHASTDTANTQDSESQESEAQEIETQESET